MGLADIEGVVPERGDAPAEFVVRVVSGLDDDVFGIAALPRRDVAQGNRIARPRVVDVRDRRIQGVERFSRGAGAVVVDIDRGGIIVQIVVNCPLDSQR